MSRVRSLALWLCLCAVSGVWPASFVHAQIDPESTRSLDIGISAARLAVTESGDFVVGVQEIFDPQDTTTQTTGKMVSRIVVVDVQQLKIIATRDFPAVRRDQRYYWTGQMAVSRKSLFYNHSEQGLLELNLSDLRTVNTFTEKLDSRQVKRSIDDPLMVISDQLLCSRGGRLRFDLPGLKPSSKWARPQYLPVQDLPASDSPAIQRDRAGWQIDNQVFDPNLELLYLVPDTPRKVDRASGLDRRRRSESSWVEGHCYDWETGCLIVAETPIQLPRTEFPVTLTVCTADGNPVGHNHHRWRKHDKCRIKGP